MGLDGWAQDGHEALGYGRVWMGGHKALGYGRVWMGGHKALGYGGFGWALLLRVHPFYYSCEGM